MTAIASLPGLPIAPRAERVLQKAGELAVDLHHLTITPVHLGLALLNSNAGSHYHYLAQIGFEFGACAGDLLPHLPPPEIGFGTGSVLSYSQAAIEVIAMAELERQATLQLYIGTQHLLLAVLKYPSVAADTLRKHGLEYAGVKQALFPDTSFVEPRAAFERSFQPLPR